MPKRTSLPSGFEKGVFSVAAARASEISPGRLRGLDLSAPFWGIRSIERESSIRDLCNAFMLRLPPRAFFCSVTAAQLMDIPLPARCENAPLHIGVAYPERAVTANGVIGHQLNLPRSAIVHSSGLPLLAPAHIWCDLARELSVPELVAAGDYLVHRKRATTSVVELRSVLASYRRLRGVPKAREALGLLSEHAESPPESALRVAIVQAGLPVPGVNVPILDERGRFVARPDLRFTCFRVVVEYEGDGHRTSQAQWRRDISRTRELEALGWHVFRVTAADLGSLRALINQLAALLRTRGWNGTRGS